MAWWQIVLDVLGLFAFLAVLAFVVLYLRRRLLGRTGGTFECSVRMQSKGDDAATSGSRGWLLGLARYSAADQLEWFRVFSFSPRPKHVFDRSLTVTHRRSPQGPEAFSLYSGHVVVGVVLASGQPVELAMSEGALTGFLAWTEAAPPGHERLLN